MKISAVNFSQVFLIIYTCVILLLPRLGAIDTANVQWLGLGIVSLIHSIYNFDKFRNNLLINGWIPILFYAFFFSVFISFFNANNISEYIIQTTKFLIIFSIFINSYLSFKSNSSLINFFLICISVTYVIEVLSVINIFRLNFEASIVEKIGRSTVYKGIAGNINIAAYSILLKSLGLLYLIYKVKKPIFKFFGMIFLLMGFFSIALTGSRGALLGIFLVIFIMLLLSIINFVKTKKINELYNTSYYILPFIASSLITEFVFNTLRVSYRASQIIERGSSSRLRYWEDAFNAFWDFPITGIGFGNWRIESMFYNKDYMRDYVVPYHAHNDFLQMFAELGIIGGLAFLGMFIFSAYVLINKLFLSNNDNERSLLTILFLMLVVYSVDSSFNFPVSRPIVVIPFFILLAGIASYDNSKHKLFNLNFSKSLLVFSFLSVLVSSFTHYKIYRSAIDQANLYLDYNAGSFNDPIDVIKNYEEIFPNITQTGMPIKALKAHYYVENDSIETAIKILKEGPKYFDNPYIGIYEAKLAHIYNDRGESDSAFKYANIAWNKIPNNQYHAGHLMQASSELENFDMMEKVFKNNSKYQQEGIWYYFLTRIYSSGEWDNEKRDSLIQLSIEARRLFPQNNQMKLIFQELVYGSDTMIKADSLANLAQLYYSNKDYDKALKYYNEASELIPTEYSHRQNQGLTYIGLGQLDNAVQKFTYVIDSMILPNSNGRIYSLRGGVNLVNKEIDLACNDFIKATQKKDSLGSVFLNQHCGYLSQTYNPDF